MTLAGNPALPLLALLSAAGPIVFQRLGGAWRELGIPWAAAGLAGMALLAPALALPSGVPSPAGTLAGVVPWQQASSAGSVPAAVPAAPAAPAGNPVLRDVTFQIQPWLLFARRELRAGRLPGWNPHQSAGTPFWGNGQSAPLFPLHLLFVVLPLQLGFVLLPWLRIVIAGCGAWMLARELGLGMPAGLLAALIFPLSGMLVSFALFPMGNALALVPWVLWAVERLAAAADMPGTAAAGATAPTAALAAPIAPTATLAAASGLLLLGGHPETAAHTALLSLLYLAVRGAGRPLPAWLGWAAGWLGGALVAAVHLVPLVLTLPETARWQAGAHAGAEPPLGLLLRQPLRLVLPEMYGHPAHGTWWGPFNYSATAVYAGALALPLAAAGLARCRRDRRWRALAVVCAFAFAAAYHCPGVRDVLGALPVLGRAAPHRLLFAVELGAALFAGAGCEEWLAGRGRAGILAGGGAVAAALLAAWALCHADWTVHGLTRVETAWTAFAAVSALLLALSLRLEAAARSRLLPLLPALALCDLLLAHGAIKPGLPLANLYPTTGAVRFLTGKPGRVAGVGEALRPDAAMVYGLADVRGDDPVKLVRYAAAYDHLAVPDPVYFQPITHWDSPWLDVLSVRWVVAGVDAPPAAPGWRLAYAGADARVYERPTALPMVRWEEGDAARGVSVDASQPGRWDIAWQSAVARRLVVGETWERGWSAWSEDGRPLPLEAAAGGTLLGVRVGPGEGRVGLRYQPPGLIAGAWLSIAGLVGLAGFAVAEARR